MCRHAVTRWLSDKLMNKPGHLCLKANSRTHGRAVDSRYTDIHWLHTIGACNRSMLMIQAIAAP
jgi:hypothetical protein